MNLVSWRPIFFIQLLGLALVGNAFLPGVGSVAGWVTVWAVLGLRYGLGFLGLSAFLDPRTWQALYAEYVALIQPMFSFVGTVQQMVSSGDSVQQIQSYVSSSLPVQLASSGGGSFSWLLVALLPLECAVFIGAVWVLKRRMGKIRRMTRPVMARLPGRR